MVRFNIAWGCRLRVSACTLLCGGLNTTWGKITTNITRFHYWKWDNFLVISIEITKIQPTLWALVQKKLPILGTDAFWYPFWISERMKKYRSDREARASENNSNWFNVFQRELFAKREHFRVSLKYLLLNTVIMLFILRRRYHKHILVTMQ